MTVEQLRNAYNAQPFQPFAIHLADGRHISVASKEYIVAAPSGRTIVVFQPDDTMNVIDVLLITDLEFKSASTGGRKRSKS
jgi:hypothetical protein